MKAASSPHACTAGLVLAGGRSSRFGANKALAHFRGDLLLDRALRPLQELAAIAISAREGSPIEAIARERGVTVVTDDPNYPSGPLAGILAGLAWAEEHGFRFLATVPCDTPVLPRNLVPVLLSGIASARAAYAETAEGDHPLCAVWSVALKRELDAALAHGRHPPVREVLHAVGARAVHFSETAAFTNTNTPQALSALERSF